MHVFDDMRQSGLLGLVVNSLTCVAIFSCGEQCFDDLPPAHAKAVMWALTG